MALPSSLGARQYGKFRETRHGRIVVGTTNEDEATILSDVLSASGDNEVIAAPVSGNNLVIKGFHLSNRNSSGITVSLKAGSDGVEKFPVYLAASGGNFDKNLVGRYWRLPLGKPLIVNLSADGDVLITIEYEGEAEPGQEAVTPSDSLSIAEAITKKAVKLAKTDAQSISVSLDKVAVTLGKSESLPISEALANSATLRLSDSLVIAESEIEGTGVRGLADSITFSEELTLSIGEKLADSEGIAEAVGNLITLSLNDAVDFSAADIVIECVTPP